MAIDMELLTNRGSGATAPTARLENVDMPQLVVGQPAVLKMRFHPAAHKVIDIEFEKGGLVAIGADISPNGELELIGLKPGTTKLKVGVAHAETLLVATKELTLTVKESA